MAARSLNKVTLIGNLTRDPEMRYTPSGSAVTTFGLATNRSWTPSDGGETQEETEYHRIVAWGKLAEICSQLLFKGRKIYCEGRLQTRKWSGQDGAERQTTEIVIDNMIALGQPKNGYEEDDFTASPTPAKPSPSKSKSADKSTNESSSTTMDEDINIDDIPF